MVIDPVLAAVAATVVGLGGVPATPASSTVTQVCSSRAGATDVSLEELRTVVAELAEAARRDPADPGLAGAVRAQVLSALPAPVAGRGGAGAGPRRDGEPDAEADTGPDTDADAVPIGPAAAPAGSSRSTPEDPGTDGWLTPTPLGGAPAETAPPGAGASGPAAPPGRAPAATAPAGGEPSPPTEKSAPRGSGDGGSGSGRGAPSTGGGAAGSGTASSGGTGGPGGTSRAGGETAPGGGAGAGGTASGGRGAPGTGGTTSGGGAAGGDAAGGDAAGGDAAGGGAAGGATAGGDASEGSGENGPAGDDTPGRGTGSGSGAGGVTSQTCSGSPRDAEVARDIAATISEMTSRIIESIMGVAVPVFPAGRDGDDEDSGDDGDSGDGSDSDDSDDSDDSTADPDRTDPRGTGGSGTSGSHADTDADTDPDDSTAPGSPGGGARGPGSDGTGSGGTGTGGTGSSSTGAGTGTDTGRDTGTGTGGTAAGSTDTGTGTPTTPGRQAAALDRALRDLAAALQASTDPAVQQLGGELLDILAAGPVVTAPLPGTGRPTGTAAADVVPETVNALFQDDFESGHLGKWGTCQGAGVNGDCAELTVSDGMGVTEDPQRGLVAQFSVTDGEEAEMGGERSEVRDGNNPGTLVKEGDERWYSWSMQFPADFPEPDGGWNIVMQWHQRADSGSPPLALDISRGSLDIGGDGADAPRETIGPIRRGEWVDYVLHVGFSQGDGFVEAWENGVQTVSRTSRQTMADESSYLKMGIYRDPDATGDAEVRFDDFTIHGGS